MQFVRQLFYILFFYALGEFISLFLNGFIPGSVLGMILLFGALEAGWIRADKVKGAAELLTAAMGLFFVPAGVGLIAQTELLQRYWLPVVAAMLLSTAAVLAVTGGMQEYFERRKADREAEKDKPNLPLGQ